MTVAGVAWPNSLIARWAPREGLGRVEELGAVAVPKDGMRKRIRLSVAVPVGFSQGMLRAAIAEYRPRARVVPILGVAREGNRGKGQAVMPQVLGAGISAVMGVPGASMHVSARRRRALRHDRSDHCLEAEESEQRH